MIGRLDFKSKSRLLRWSSKENIRAKRPRFQDGASSTWVVILRTADIIKYPPNLVEMSQNRFQDGADKKAASSFAELVRPNNKRYGVMFGQFCAGAFSGLTNTIVFNPLDVVKTRMQVMSPSDYGSMNNGAKQSASRSGHGFSPTGVYYMLREMYRYEGIASYYKGLNASLWALVPTWAIYWFAYEEFKTAVPAYTNLESRHSVNMAASVAAGAVTTFATAPMWVVKTRMQTELAMGKERQYPTLIVGLRRIFQNEGVFALYRGIFPSLFGLVHVAIQFPVYEELKTRFERHETMPATVRVMLASSVSKVAASICAYPHEVLRSRLQATSSPVTGAFSDFARMCITCKEIYQSAGIMGFYSGMTANLLRTVPSTMMTFVTYELTKEFLLPYIVGNDDADIKEDVK